MLEVEAGNETGIYYVTVSNVRPAPASHGSQLGRIVFSLLLEVGASLTGCSSPLTRSGRN